MLKLLKVTGDSMFPTIKSGDFILIWRWASFQIGDIVVAKHEKFGLIVKRISLINDQHYELSGDNRQQSTSQKKLGIFTKQQLIGKVIWHIKQ